MTPQTFNFAFFSVWQSVQAVFRSLASLEKTVEKCHIVLQEQKNRLTFTLHCKHGIENVPLFHHQFCEWCSSRPLSFLCLYSLLFFRKFYFITLCIKCFCDFFFFIAGLLKTHNLSFQDSESLQAMFDKDSYANVFRTHARSAKHSYIPFVNTWCISRRRLKSKTVSSPHVGFLCFLFCSDCWRTQWCTSLNL